MRASILMTSPSLPLSSLPAAELNPWSTHRRWFRPNRSASARSASLEGLSSDADAPAPIGVEADA